MITVVYIINSPSLSDAILAAKDVCYVSGLKPAIISNGIHNYKFNEPDAARVSDSKMTDEEYAEKNVIL